MFEPISLEDLPRIAGGRSARVTIFREFPMPDGKRAWFPVGRIDRELAGAAMNGLGERFGRDQFTVGR